MSGVRTDQVRSGQVRSIQVDSGQVRRGQIRAGKVRTGEVTVMREKERVFELVVKYTWPCVRGRGSLV